MESRLDESGSWNVSLAHSQTVFGAACVLPLLERPLSEMLQEQFSLAFVHAVATVAGFTVTRPSVDRQSIDLIVESSEAGTQFDCPRLELQIKCTSLDTGQGEHLVHDLPIKNYTDLQKKSYVPRLLVVVTVKSRIPQEWLREEPEALILRGSGLFFSLSTAAQSSNDKTVRLKIPRTQRFSVEALRTLMNTIANGGRP
jgi:Domain of unknown function (DUF4365)